MISQYIFLGLAHFISTTLSSQLNYLDFTNAIRWQWPALPCNAHHTIHCCAVPGGRRTLRMHGMIFWPAMHWSLLPLKNIVRALVNSDWQVPIACWTRVDPHRTQTISFLVEYDLGAGLANLYNMRVMYHHVITWQRRNFEFSQHCNFGIELPSPSS